MLSNSQKGEFLLIEIELQIGNRIFSEQGVLDTGSKKSCINKSFIHDNNLTNWVEENENKVIGVNGEPLIINETISADILFKNGTATRHSWILMDSLPVTILIGTDIMRAHGSITVDFEKGTVTDSYNMVLLNDTQEGICDLSKIEPDSDCPEKPKTNEREIPESIFDGSKMDEHQRKRVKEVLSRFSDIIITKNEDAVCTNFEATIPILETAEPFTYQKPYPIDLNYQEPAKVIIEKWLADGKIEKTQSPYNAPVVVVPKKNLPTDPPGTIRVRPCLDFRALNKKIAADPCITERLGDILAQTTKHKWRSSFDMPSAYLQIPLAKADRHKTAFYFLGTQYQFTCCPFGLNISGSAFQRAMNKVMEGLDRRFIRSYVDDVLCTTETFDEHIMIMEQFFENVRKNGMKLSYDKMSIGQEKLLFLGMELTDNGFGINPKKIEGIAGITELKSKKDARSYIGMLGFFKSHIPCFSERTRAISDSIQGPSFQFTDEMKAEMDILREMIKKCPIRAYPQIGVQFILYTDASHHTAAYALCQIQDGEERIIHDGGKKFPGNKLHLSIFEKELWAVKIALKSERYLLRGARFLLKTDSLAVCNCLAPKAKELRSFPSDKVARWCTEILDFDFELVKIKSDENLLADAISRLPRDTTPGPDKILMLTEDQEPEDLRELLTHVHDNYGHGGINRTLRLFRRHSSNKNARKIVQNWVQSCEYCQKYRHYTGNGISSNISDYERPERPLEKVQIDLHCISPISVGGFRYVMGIICELTTYARFYPLRSKSAKETAEKLGRFLTEEGASVKSIKTDMGTEFMAEFMRKAQEHGVAVEKATPYWKKKNASVERGFGKLKSCMKSIHERNGRSWVVNLSRANMLYNALPQQSTGLSPFQSVYGHVSRQGQEMIDDRPREEIEAILNDKWSNWGKKAHKEPKTKYEVDQRVLIRIPPKAERGLNCKYGQLYQGPYVVREKINPSTYLVQVDKRFVKKNVAQLRPYVERLDNLFDAPDDPVEVKEDHDLNGCPQNEPHQVQSNPDWQIESQIANDEDQSIESTEIGIAPSLSSITATEVELTGEIDKPGRRQSAASEAEARSDQNKNDRPPDKSETGSAGENESSMYIHHNSTPTITRVLSSPGSQDDPRENHLDTLGKIAEMNEGDFSQPTDQAKMHNFQQQNRSSLGSERDKSSEIELDSVDTEELIQTMLDNRVSRLIQEQEEAEGEATDFTLPRPRNTSTPAKIGAVPETAMVQSSSITPIQEENGDTTKKGDQRKNERPKRSCGPPDRLNIGKSKKKSYL